LPGLDDDNYVVVVAAGVDFDDSVVAYRRRTVPMAWLFQRMMVWPCISDRLESSRDYNRGSCYGRVTRVWEWVDRGSGVSVV